MSVNKFTIGIETEGFWKGKAGSNLPGDHAEDKDFAEALVPCYNKIRKDKLRADFSHGSHPGHYEDPDNKQRWVVALDSAIGELSLGGPRPNGRTYSTTLCRRRHHFHKVNKHTDPLEFVSPKFTFGQSSEWRTEVKKHWSTLLRLAEVKVDQMCATHVHVSPRKEERWSLEPLKRVAKAIIYFNDAFKAIYAPSRRKHDLTQSNKDDNYKLKDLDFAACCERIENCASNRELINLMQAGGSKHARQTRDYAWNFENTDKMDKPEGPIGTIGASHDS